MQRIGVFVCHCGTNIAATVDVKKVVEMAAKEPGVVHAEDYQYMCSEAGQAKIINAIHEKNLTGIVVCSCSPRMHEATFRKAAQKAGLNPYMVEIANIREHCSWIHKDMEEATLKAVILARAAIAKVNLDAPLQPGESLVTKRALVIGGGIAGYCRCRLRSRYRGENTEYWWKNVPAGQDLPNSGLLCMYPHPEDGRGSST